MKYSKDEILILKNFYSKYGATGNKGCVLRIKEKLGIDRKPRALIQKARKLGLTYKGENKGIFRKGHVPFNKGEAMSEETYKKCSKTFFKKGNEPHNTKFDGCLSFRTDKNSKAGGYWYIRIDKAKWIPLHRYIYQKTYNVFLSSSDVIRFKDGNSRNLKVENLEHVTRTKNLFKNNPKTNYPEEVLQIMETINLIDNKIKKIKKNGKK